MRYFVLEAGRHSDGLAPWHSTRRRIRRRCAPPCEPRSPTRRYSPP